MDFNLNKSLSIFVLDLAAIDDPKENYSDIRITLLYLQNCSNLKS